MHCTAHRLACGHKLPAPAHSAPCARWKLGQGGKQHKTSAHRPQSLAILAPPAVVIYSVCALRIVLSQSTLPLHVGRTCQHYLVSLRSANVYRSPAFDARTMMTDKPTALKALFPLRVPPRCRQPANTLEEIFHRQGQARRASHEQKYNKEQLCPGSVGDPCWSPCPCSGILTNDNEPNRRRHPQVAAARTYQN